MIVVDASIAVKWFIPESLSVSCVHLLTRGDKLIAPSIIRYEVTAALAKAVRMDRINTDAAALHINRWIKMLDNHAISLMDTGIDFSSAVTLSLAQKHPFHDCFYLALAARLNSPLATTDKRLMEQAETLGLKLLPISMVN
jgi:predicted nucleic acid-binding protein